MNQDAIGGGRLFFAAVPGTDASARIFQLAQALRQAHKFPGKLIAPECLHVSLFFLGEIDEQLVRIASDAAAEVRALPFGSGSIAPPVFGVGPATGLSC